MDTPRHPNPWAPILAASERARFSLDAVLPEDARFDFARPLLPDTLTGVDELPFLTATERLLLGHIRAHGYLAMFGVVEEFILPFVVDHAGVDAPGDRERTRALLGFAAEEAKHIQLFERFRRVFTRGFGHVCEMAGAPEELAAAVLAQPPLSIALLVLHIEWMTQHHWLAAARDDQSIDPAFAELLRVHWMEESQHARIDTLVVREIAAGLSRAEVEAGLAGYADLVQMLDGGLLEQAELDRTVFERATGRVLDAATGDELVRVQHASMRRAFLLDGIRHPAFLRTVADLHPNASAFVAAITDRFQS